MAKFILGNEPSVLNITVSVAAFWSIGRAGAVVLDVVS